MQRASRVIVVTALFVAAACGGGDTIAAPETPRAFIRFVNAMPDTFGVDFHGVDIVENVPYIATLFRDIKQAGYTPVASGSRHFREFLSIPNASTSAVVTQVLFDTTMNLAAGAHYTMTHAGFARSGRTPAARFVVLRDSLPTPPAGQIAVRVINLAAGVGSVDIYLSATTTGALPTAPTFANAAYLVPSSYVNVPISASLALRGTIAGVGSAGTVIATGTAPAGNPGTASLDPIPGSAIAGSVFTVYVFSPSTLDSWAPQSDAFQRPAIVVVPDVQLHNRPGA